MAYEHYSTCKAQPAVHGDDCARENPKENERTADLKRDGEQIDGRRRERERLSVRELERGGGEEKRGKGERERGWGQG